MLANVWRRGEKPKGRGTGAVTYLFERTHRCAKVSAASRAAENALRWPPRCCLRCRPAHRQVTRMALPLAPRVERRAGEGHHDIAPKRARRNMKSILHLQSPRNRVRTGCAAVSAPSLVSQETVRAHGQRSRCWAVLAPTTRQSRGRLRPRVACIRATGRSLQRTNITADGASTLQVVGGGEHRRRVSQQKKARQACNKATWTKAQPIAQARS